MLWKRTTFLFIFFVCVEGVAFSGECGSSPAKKIDLNLWSAPSLRSPDQQWNFVSVGRNSAEQKASLYIQNVNSSKKWNVGWIERNGTAFWSDDSKRLLLRDEYAADDTKIRIFDVTGPAPKELSGLDAKIRRAIFEHIPETDTTLWLYYPQVCFAANDSSTIIVVADAPLVRKRESSSGRPFGLRLTVDVNSLRIVDSRPVASLRQPSGQESLNAGTAPVGWHKVDAGPFSILAPPGWEFHQLTGVDSYVGEFVGDSLTLRFDFGRYSSSLKEARKPAYVITKESIGGFRAKVASPRGPGHGITGVYFRDVGRSNALCLFGQDLTSTQQELALKIFKTIRFGGTLPRFVIPPPPLSTKNQ